MNDIVYEFDAATAERPFDLWCVSLGSEWCSALELKDAKIGLSAILEERIIGLRALRLGATSEGSYAPWVKRIGLPTGPRFA